MTSQSLIILALILATSQAATSLNFEVKLCDAGEYFYYDSKTENGCLSCPEGTSSNGTVPILKCTPCAPGFYAPGKGYKWCSPCGRGTYEQGRTACKNCGYGYTSAVGSSSPDDCGVCARGAIRKPEDSKGCQDCPAGTFEVNRKTCLSCPPGMVSDEGSSECIACPVGWIAVNNGTQCLPCPGGSRDVNRTSCELCPEGTFYESGQCTTCPAGSITPFAGSLTCTRCQPGTFEYNKTACFVCAAGTYGIDGISCRQCPNLTISGVGSSNCTQCSTGTKAVKGNTRCQGEDESEAGVQTPTTPTTVTNNTGNNSNNDNSQSNTFFYVLGVGIIGALLFVGVSIRNRKLEYEIQRDGFMPAL